MRVLHEYLKGVELHRPFGAPRDCDRVRTAAALSATTKAGAAVIAGQTTSAIASNGRFPVPLATA
jgi:hypothetical protein